MTQHTRADVIRMAGHLLLHHPTTGALCRVKWRPCGSSLTPFASCWCLHGALGACGVKLLGKEVSFGKVFWSPYRWDHATDVERHAYAARLANYQEGDDMS